jgi:seryl-tRNA synthetase
MHDIKAIRDNPDAFDAALNRRTLSAEDKARFSSKSLLDLDEERRKTIQMVEQWQEQRNRISKEIGIAKKSGDEAKAAELMEQVSRLKSDIAHAGEQVAGGVDERLNKLLAEIPNLPLDEVPDGVDEHGNVEHHHYGEKRNYAFKPKEHVELGEALKFMDFEAAARMSGARFVVLKKGLARLERAIGQFMLDLHTGEHGYTEVNPPLLVRDEIMTGTAQLPKFQYDQFVASRISVRDDLLIAAIENIDSEFEKRNRSGSIRKLIEELLEAAPTKEDFWLIPTAEVPLTNLVRESILDEKELPMRLTALTPCFRAEAGAAGRDTRGMIRQHQFTKVELVSITTPEESKNEHERMLSCAEEVLKKLDLHYRVMTLCTGDMGFASQKTYDIEVWMPGQISSQGEGGMYREISSCSVCGDFQARRMDARSRGPDGKPRFVHTLNGSGTAVGRALIAVMETYQQADGSIAVPDVLQPYMGGLKVIAKE